MARSMYQRLMEHLTTAVLLLDGELRLKWMNPSAEALLAVSLTRVKGLGLVSLMEHEDGLGEVLGKARDEFHPFTQREARLVMQGGETLTVDYTVTPLSEEELLLEIEPRDRLMRISREEALLTRQETVKVLTRGRATSRSISTRCWSGCARC